jgi:hypothetical protein
MTRLSQITAAALMWALPCCVGVASPAWAEFGGELAALEAYVRAHPADVDTRRNLGEAYAARGLVEDAVREYAAVLLWEPGDEKARARAKELIASQMPVWLPAGVEGVGVLSCMMCQMGMRGTTAGAGTPAPQPEAETHTYRLLVTEESFQAREGERFDQVHGKKLSWVDYGYAWDEARGRWEMRVRVHWQGERSALLARQALRATLAWYCVAREYLGCDPTRPWGQPVDVWLMDEGEPGARAVGRSMYLYAVKTPREPSEWVREVAHEYGHIALPGIGGFTDTDDPWADGHLSELLFTKWLSASGIPRWMPWSVEGWEQEARVERERLVVPARGEVNPPRLTGTGEDARDCFLGLALWVEEEMGPGFLGDVLRRCPRGTAGQFMEAVRGLVEERGLEQLSRD